MASNFTVSGEDLSDIFSFGLDKEVTAYKVGNANLKYRAYGSRHYLKKSNFVTNFLINGGDLVNTFEQEIIDTVNVGTYGTDFNMIPVTNGCLLLMVNTCTITFKITHVNITAYIVGGGGGGGGSGQNTNAGGGGGGGGVLVQSGNARNIKKIEFTLGSGGNGGIHENSGSNGNSSVYKTTNTDNTTRTFIAYAGGGGGCGKGSGLDGANGGGHGSYSNNSPSVGDGFIAAFISAVNTTYASDGDGVTLICGKNGGSGQQNDNDKGSGGGGGGVNGVGGTNNNGGTNNGGGAYPVTIGDYTFHLGGGGGTGYGGGDGGSGGGNGGSGVNGADLTAGNASEGLVTGTTVYGFGGGGGGRGNRENGSGGAGGNGCCLLYIINSNVTFP